VKDIPSYHVGHPSNVNTLQLLACSSLKYRFLHSISGDFTSVIFVVRVCSVVSCDSAPWEMIDNFPLKKKAKQSKNRLRHFSDSWCKACPWLCACRSVRRCIVGLISISQLREILG
jgi:hypothetical protein